MVGRAALRSRPPSADFSRWARVLLRPAWPSPPAVREHDVAGGFVEAKIGEAKGVLHAMGGEERTYVLQIAAAEDERDDGLRSDGIEASGGRIVEDHGRTIYQGAGDGNAAAHSAGKLGGIFFEGLLELDEAECFADALVDFGFVHGFLAEAEGNVVRDGEGIEERAFLEDEADLAAEIQQLGFGHFAYVVAHDEDLAGIGMNEASGEAHDQGLAGAGFA